MQVRAGRPDGGAQFRTEEPVQNGYDRHHEQPNNENGVHVERLRALAHFLQIAQGNQQGLFIHIEGLIGFHTHDGQIDRPQTQLGQNARQNSRNAAGRVQKAGSQSRQHSRQNGAQKRQPDVAAARDHHDAHRAARAEGAVYRQISDVQNFIGNVYADGHDAPDQSLRDRPRERVEKTGQTSFPHCRGRLKRENKNE